MEVLREQEAVGYLGRLENSLSPHFVVRNDFKALLMMVEMQRAYLLSLMQDGEDARDFAKITITSSGFPELESWIGDIRRANSNFESIRQRRTRAFVPVLDEVAQSSKTNSYVDLTTQLQVDEILASAFGKDRDQAQDEFFKTILTKDRTNLIEEDAKSPGFLKMRFKLAEGKKTTSIVKYIDGNNPVLIRFRSNPPDNLYNIPNLERQVFPDENTRNGGVFGNDDWEEQVSDLRFNLRRRLLFGDYSLEGTNGFGTALSEMVRFETLLQTFSELSSMLMKGKALKGNEYVNTVDDTISKLRYAIDQASSDEARELFEQCLRVQIASIKGTSEDISVGAKGLIVRNISRDNLFGRLWRKAHGWL